MNLENIFCPNIECPARGQSGRGNINVHSVKEKRCYCQVCEKTFSVSPGSIFYRLKTEPQTVILVLTLLAYGCPVQAIVVAFGLDERTVKRWWIRAGEHCQRVHEQVVGGSQLDLQQVQADEIKIKLVGGVLWMALALMVPTRLWLGGVISRQRDQGLIQSLADQIRRVAVCRPLLLAVDGLTSYVGAFQRAFRSPLPRWGQPGRCQLRPWSEIAIVQVVKQRANGSLSIVRRIVQGTSQQVTDLLQTSQTGGQINTAFIERLNATFRQRLPWLARRSRNLARQPETLQAGMFMVGCIYNFCTYHDSLRVAFYLAQGGQRWLQRTPAIAADLTDHRWTIEELFNFKVPPPRWTPPKRRGPMSDHTKHLLKQWCN